MRGRGGARAVQRAWRWSSFFPREREGTGHWIGDASIRRSGGGAERSEAEAAGERDLAILRTYFSTACAWIETTELKNVRTSQYRVLPPSPPPSGTHPRFW